MIAPPERHQTHWDRFRVGLRTDPRTLDGAAVRSHSGPAQISPALSGRIPEFWIVVEFKLVLRFLRNSSAAPVHAGLVETPSESEMAHQRLPEWPRNPRISDPIGSILRVGRCRGWKPRPSNESSPRSSQPMLRATAA